MQRNKGLGQVVQNPPRRQPAPLSLQPRRGRGEQTRSKPSGTDLDSSGNAKTSPNCSRQIRYLELHFGHRKRIASAKSPAFGHGKSRLNRLTHEDRSYHIFSHFLAGATPTERDRLNIEDPSGYALLASSGTHRLPSGPISGNSIATGELRVASTRFNPKAVTSILSLVAILELGNLQFYGGDQHGCAAYVLNAPVLGHIPHVTGVGAEELS